MNQPVTKANARHHPNVYNNTFQQHENERFSIRYFIRKKAKKFSVLNVDDFRE